MTPTHCTCTCGWHGTRRGHPRHRSSRPQTEWRQHRIDEGVRPIRISDLGEKLSAEDAFTATCIAMEELALAQALVIVHGRERAAQMYVERGGHVRYDDEGEPVLLWSERLAVSATAPDQEPGT